VTLRNTSRFWRWAWEKMIQGKYMFATITV
jgi:hypothetical protein